MLILTLTLCKSNGNVKKNHLVLNININNNYYYLYLYQAFRPHVVLNWAFYLSTSQACISQQPLCSEFSADIEFQTSCSRILDPSLTRMNQMGISVLTYPSPPSAHNQN